LSFLPENIRTRLSFADWALVYPFFHEVDPFPLINFLKDHRHQQLSATSFPPPPPRLTFITKSPARLIEARSRPREKWPVDLPHHMFPPPSFGPPFPLFGAKGPRFIGLVAPLRPTFHFVIAPQDEPAEDAALRRFFFPLLPFVRSSLEHRSACGLPLARTDRPMCLLPPADPFIFSVPFPPLISRVPTRPPTGWVLVCPFFLGS